MGIVNSGQLSIYEDIDKDLKKSIEDVLFNRDKNATEKLIQLAEQYKDTKNEVDQKGNKNGETKMYLKG